MTLKLRLAVCLLGPLLCGCGASTTVARPTGGTPAPTVTSMSFPHGIDESIGLQRDPALADVDPAHIRHTDSMLVSFGTRNTFSDTVSTTRGIGAARRWIFSEFER